MDNLNRNYGKHILQTICMQMMAPLHDEPKQLYFIYGMASRTVHELGLLRIT